MELFRLLRYKVSLWLSLEGVCTGVVEVAPMSDLPPTSSSMRTCGTMDDVRNDETTMSDILRYMEATAVSLH